MVFRSLSLANFKKVDQKAFFVLFSMKKICFLKILSKLLAKKNFNQTIQQLSLTVTTILFFFLKY